MAGGLVRPYSPALNLVTRLMDAALIVAAHLVAVQAHDEYWRDAHTTATLIAVVEQHAENAFSFAVESQKD